jgi:diguanylate cyclase (GGDEF)-like protein
MIWIVLLLSLRAVIQLLDIPGGHNFYGLLITCLIIGFAWFQSGVRRQFRAFLLGIIFYLIGSVLDWLGRVFHETSFEGQAANTLDDIFFALGFFFIGLAFIRTTRERDELERKLYQQAYHDELTGLGNRRALFEKLDEMLRTQSGTLLYIDVNHFKQVNDQFGHEQGDLVLQACADLLKQSAGIAYRIGGDEFVLLLADEDAAAISAQLEQQVIPLTQSHGISFSIGIAPFSANSSINPDDLLATADQQMYAAKQIFRANARNEAPPR